MLQGDRIEAQDQGLCEYQRRRFTRPDLDGTDCVAMLKLVQSRDGSSRRSLVPVLSRVNNAKYLGQFAQPLKVPAPPQCRFMFPFEQRAALPPMFDNHLPFHPTFFFLWALDLGRPSPAS